MSKKFCFRGPFNKQHGRCAKALLKFASHHLYYIHWSLPSQLSLKKSLWLTCLFLGLLVNTLATDEKYPVLNRDNFTILIQMQLSLRQETLSQVFSAILKFTLCSQYFEKKDYPQRFFICNIKDSENVVRKMSKKSFFRGVFNKQHGGRAQKLLKSASQHLYHIHRYCDGNWGWKSLSYWHAKFGTACRHIGCREVSK